jgi:predicted amidohydrolase
MTMPATGAEFVEAAARHVERLALQDADIVLFPATPSRLRTAYDHDAVLEGMTSIARRTDVCVAFTVSEGKGATGRRAMYLVGPRGVIASHRQTHKPPGPRFEMMPMGDEPCAIANTPIGRVGLMIAVEGSVPEVARSMMLRGAEFILWAGDSPGTEMRRFARARAEENRVYVACAAAPTATGATMIVDPAGRVLDEALEGRELAIGATVNRAFSHLKARAPGTDVVRNRQPAAYGALVRSGAAVGSVL